MKKIVPIIMTLVLGHVAMAQLDTLRWGDTNYFWSDCYAPIDSLMAIYQNNEGYRPGDLYDITWAQQHFHQFHTDSGLTIYGVGLPMRSYYGSAPFYWMDLSMKIYTQKTRSNISLLDSVSITPELVRRTRLEQRMKVIPSITPQQVAYPVEWTLDTVWEFLFNRPIKVYDTFYVGFMPESDDRYVNVYSRTLARHITVAGVPIHLAWCPPTQWLYQNWDIAEGQFYLPILKAPEIDSVPQCVAPEAPSLLSTDAGQAMLRWNTNMLGDSVQISIGFDTLDPEGNTCYTLGGTTFQFTGLLPGRYAAWVRNECHHHCIWHDTLEWSNWSAPLLFSIESYDSLSIPNESMAHHSPLITLFPNPTTGEVRVECGVWSVEMIEVLDPQGRLLMEKEYSLSPKPYTLNLSSLPKGSYLLRIHTDQGTFTRKVVRE